MSSKPDSLADSLKQGGLLSGTRIDAKALQRAARGLELPLFDVDCSRAKSKSAVLRAIAKAAEFPEHFGGNLDALYDCLCDTVLEQKFGMVLALRHLHDADPGLAEHVPAIAQVGEDVVEFARENGKVFTFILESAPG